MKEKKNYMNKNNAIDVQLLKYMTEHCNMSLEDVLNDIENMKNQDILKEHPYAVSQGSNGRWYTYLPDESKPKGRRQIAKSTKEKIEQEIIRYYKNKSEEENIRNMKYESIVALVGCKRA